MSATIVEVGMRNGKILPVVSENVIRLCSTGIEIARSTGDRVTARAFFRAARALLGEQVKTVDPILEQEFAAGPMNEDDFKEAIHNCEGVLRKIKDALEENEKSVVVSYLRSLKRMLGTKESEGSGALTPRPRDYHAAMSRISEN